MSITNKMLAWIRQVVLALVTLSLAPCSGADDQQVLQRVRGYPGEQHIREVALELKDALQRNPGNDGAGYLRGRINLDIGDSAAAEKEFRHAREAGWQEEEVQIGLARALLNGRKLQKLPDEVEIREEYSPTTRANPYDLHAAAQAGLDEVNEATVTLVAGATMMVYDKFHNLIRIVIGDANAEYSTRIKARGNAYPLTIEVEDGTDPVTGMAPDFKMVSVILSPSVKQANINPFSTMIVKAARTASGALSRESVSIARAAVMRGMNFGLDPLIVADPISTRITDSNVAVLIKSSEAMGEMIRRVRDQVNISGAVIDGNDVVAALADDISDGIVNGVGGSLANPRISAVSKLVSAQVLIEALSNNLKVQGAVATSITDDAILDTHPSAGPEQLTDSVTINREMLEQTREALYAAQALEPSVELRNLSDILDSIPAGSLPFDIESVLPGDSGVDLDPVITSAVFATDEELELVNNSAPQLSGNPLTSVLEGSDYLFEPDASDADGDMLVFTISNKPSWASFESANGRLSGTPGSMDVDVYSDIVISVSDGLATDSVGPFSITVEGVNQAPAISGNTPSSANEGALYVFVPTASDPDGDTLVFSILGRPSWTTFNNSTGQLSGTPDASDAGTFSNILISVSDGMASSSLPAFSIVVNANVSPNTAPTISGTPSTTAEEDSTYTYQPNASDADGDALTFSISNRPAWASFSSSNGRLSGTPAQGDAGTYSNIVISVSDGSVTTALPAFSIRVDMAQARTGGFTLSWTAPESRADGTSLPLSEIASYSINYGTSPGDHPNRIEVAYPAQTQTVTNLPVGTYYVVMTTKDHDGRESSYSQEITKYAQ